MEQQTPKNIDPETGKFLKGIVPWISGRKHTEETKQKIKEKRALQTNVFPIKNVQRLAVIARKGKKFPHTEETKEKIRNTMIEKGLTFPILIGDRNNKWKGGITPLSQKIRHSKEYKLWRKSVFDRDDYRCYDCGERGGYLEAHHVYSFADFPRIRFDIHNGQTLCRECHKNTDTYMVKSRWLNKNTNAIQ